MGSEDFAKQVPTVYYDLIARVVPGLAFGATILLGVQWDFSNLKELPGASVLVVVGVFTASYLVGLMLSTLSRFDEILRHPILTFRSLRNRTTPQEDMALTPLRVADANTDYIEKQSPDFGGRLLKLRAEARLCKNLLTGWLLICLGTPFGWVFPNTARSWTLLLGLAALFLCASINRQRLYCRRAKQIRGLFPENKQGNDKVAEDRQRGPENQGVSLTTPSA